MLKLTPGLALTGVRTTGPWSPQQTERSVAHKQARANARGSCVRVWRAVKIAQMFHLLHDWHRKYRGKLAAREREGHSRLS